MWRDLAPYGLGEPAKRLSTLRHTNYSHRWIAASPPRYVAVRSG